jgi:excisionase family DNA binding protein
MTRLLTIEELADALGVKPNWVQEKGASGEIPSYKIGRYRRFDLDEVKASIRESAEKGQAA